MTCYDLLSFKGWRMLIPHGDIVMLLPQSTYFVQRGWRISTPHEDKVDLLTQSTYCSEGVANSNLMMIMM